MGAATLPKKAPESPRSRTPPTWRTHSCVPCRHSWRLVFSNPIPSASAISIAADKTANTLSREAAAGALARGRADRRTPGNGHPACPEAGASRNTRQTHLTLHAVEPTLMAVICRSRTHGRVLFRWTTRPPSVRKHAHCGLGPFGTRQSTRLSRKPRPPAHHALSTGHNYRYCRCTASTRP